MNFTITIKNFYGFFNNIFKALDSIWQYPLFTMEDQAVAISNILMAIVFMFLGLKLAKYLSNVFHEKLLRIISLDITATNLLGKIFHYLLIVIVIVFVLNIAHFPLTAFTFIGGAFAVSLGVGGQHVVNNFISGIVLMLEAPIKVGDLVEVGKIIGRVKSIDARSVNIRTSENKNIFIPHSVILQNDVTNWTFEDNKIMLSINFQLSANNLKIENLKNLVILALLERKDILPTPKPQLLLQGFDYNILKFELLFWVNISFVSQKEILSEINLKLLELFSANNIELAAHERKILQL